MSFQEELENIQKKYYKKVFEHAFRLGQEMPDEKQIPHDPCNAEDDITALTSIINLVDKVIGEDEPDETDKWTPEMESYIRQARQVIYGRNALRAKQRNKLRG